MIESKFTYRTFFVFALMIFIVGIIVHFSNLIFIKKSVEINFELIWGYIFLFISLIILIINANKRALKLKIDHTKIISFSFYGLGNKKVISLDTIDDFKIIHKHTRGNSWEYLYVFKEGKTVLKVSQFDLRNYERIKLKLIEDKGVSEQIVLSVWEDLWRDLKDSFS